jgi:hypothetical protein
MTKLYYTAQFIQTARTDKNNQPNQQNTDWNSKARALQLRRWKALRRASKSAPLQETTLV